MVGTNPFDNMITAFHWLSTGYCTALERVAKKGGRFRHIHFPAMVGLLQHSTLGWVLFDTGYSQRFFSATQRFPGRLYRQVTPVFTEPHEALVEQLRQRGIDPLSIKHIILSHFHADHVCALKDFPEATFYCHEKALRQFQQLRGIKAVKKALLADLFPENFAERCFLLNTQHAKTDPYFDHQWHPFGDNSLELVDLPGHGCGQVGLRFQVGDKPYFLLADAAWLSENFQQLLLPNPIVQVFFDDWTAYKRTLHRLHQYHLYHPEVQMIPTHCLKVSIQSGLVP
jgi:glyoxylase-like metal-dependent hydrolase (beta-lactamase superfamily II)